MNSFFLYLSSLLSGFILIVLQNTTKKISYTALKHYQCIISRDSERIPYLKTIFLKDFEEKSIYICEVGCYCTRCYCIFHKFRGQSYLLTKYSTSGDNFWQVTMAREDKDLCLEIFILDIRCENTVLRSLLWLRHKRLRIETITGSRIKVCNSKA